MRAVHRVGTEYNWKQLQQEASTERVIAEQQFRLKLISSTAQP